MAASNIKNRTIFCKDNLDILEGINSDCIDLIYLDPPFNTNKIWHAPIGSNAEGAKFDDVFKEEDVKDEWLETIKEDYDELYDFLRGIKRIGHQSNFCYLCYMAIRLIEMYRILKDTGNIYLHCDSTMSHYLKIVLDCVFDEKNFRNEIVWCYEDVGGRATKYFKRKKDVIFFYQKADTKDRIFNQQHKQLSKSTIERYGKYFDGNGIITYQKLKDSSPGAFKKLKGIPDDLSKIWLDKNKGQPISDWWIDISTIKKGFNESTGYPTQKPLKLLGRIIKASTNKGDIVLDPFCGCATTCVASEMLERQWIGIDVSIEAYNLVKSRLVKEVKPALLDPEKAVNFSTAIPVREDVAKDYRLKKWVYVISNPKYEGEYKVGIAKYVEARLNSYQTSDPDRSYKLEYKLETPFFREIEKFILDKFANKHEWVTAELKSIIKEIKSYKE